MHQRFSHPSVRKAITLVEVIFSIGVILIGLLGLMSILPLAGRRAQDSVSLSVGAQLGQTVMDELLTRRFFSDDRLLQIQPTAATIMPSLNLGGTLTPAGTSFCIDPLFAAQTTIPTNLSENGYFAPVFPYFKVNHDPLIDPSNSTGGSTPSTTWPSIQPRMIRVGITDEVHNASSPPIERILIGIEEALSLVENTDDLPVIRPDDRSQPPVFSALDSDDDGASLEYGKRVPTGEFSWIATVNPLPGNVFASVSVVILRDRERTFDVPVQTAPPASPAGNAVAERLAYVSFASGFRGGAGGTIHLVSAGNTISKLKADDWIMLSRTNPAGVSTHRWYRIVSVGEKPEVFTPVSNTVLVNFPVTIPLPNPGWARDENVWRQKVVLDGPDWFFGFTDTTTGDPINQADGTFADNTYATLIEGVVSVTERTVKLNDL